MQYVTMKIYDPATLTTLLNIKVLFTGVLIQLFFSKRLSTLQWGALCLLLLGCAIAQSQGSIKINDALGLGFILIQAFCSSLGGVYFQWTLQRKEVVKFGLWEKNIWLYFWGTIVNLIYSAIMAREIFTYEHTMKYDRYTLFMVLCNSFAGFSTSFLLKYLDAVMKEYANAITMATTAIMQTILLGLPFYISLLVGIVVVTISLILYQKEENKVVEYREISKVDDRKKGQGDEEL